MVGGAAAYTWREREKESLERETSEKGRQVCRKALKNVKCSEIYR